MVEPKRLLIMAAGTGGHIFPGLAIAKMMRERGWIVTWLGTPNGMEKSLVLAQGIEMDKIDFSGLRGKGLLYALTGSIRMMIGLAACMNIMKKRKPDLVLGMGGYITVPGGFAAMAQKIPVVLINADASLLLSNKALAFFSKKVLFGFYGNFGAAEGKVEVTGNPVRQEIMNLPKPEKRYGKREGVLRILAMGGSLGAKVLNDCLPAALALLPPEERPKITHQAGRQHAAILRLDYIQAGIDAEVLEFIEDMAEQYAKVDLVICRAGAITVSELTVAGVASILIPFIASSTNHQRENAALMAKHGAGIHLPQTELTPKRLAEEIQKLNREKCLMMAKAAYVMGRRDANEKIAEVLTEMANKSK